MATGGKNPTFFRVVPDDNIQGPQDANYAITHLHPKAVMIVDDDEAYSQGLVKVMTPVFQKAGVKVTHLTYNGTDTGATLSGALSSLANKVTSQQTVVMLPWQTAANAQQFGLDLKQQGKKVVLFGTDGTNSPSQFKIPGSYVSAFGPDISTSSAPLDKSVVAGVAKYGPYGPFGVPDLRRHGRRDAGDQVGLRLGSKADAVERSGRDQAVQHSRGRERPRNPDRLCRRRQPCR